MTSEPASALVTGGASGLGAAVARRLAAEGYTVTVLDAVASGEAAAGPVAVADVRDAEAVAEVVASTARRAPLRVVVNCAGVATPGRVIDRHGEPLELDVFRRVLDINTAGTFNVMRLTAAAMQHNHLVADERGVIVNTASIAAFEGQVGQVAYAASKGAVVAMTLAAARDLASHAIRVCAIAPGVFDTPLLAGLPGDQRAALGAEVPFPARLGSVDEFAHLVAAIVENRYLNGEVIRIDGALRMR